MNAIRNNCFNFNSIEYGLRVSQLRFLKRKDPQLLQDMSEVSKGTRKELIDTALELQERTQSDEAKKTTDKASQNKSTHTYKANGAQTKLPESHHLCFI